MDCRISDHTAVLRDGSVVSVVSDHFGDYHRRDHYYGIVIKLIQRSKKDRIKWYNDDAVSTEEVELLQSETSTPKLAESSKTYTTLPGKKKKKFTLHITDHVTLFQTLKKPSSRLTHQRQVK